MRPRCSTISSDNSLASTNHCPSPLLSWCPNQIRHTYLLRCRFHQEDEIIKDCMKNQVTKWAAIADKIPGRIGKQCRERWANHLEPSLIKTDWTPEEDQLLIAVQVVSLAPRMHRAFIF